jgi:LPXTG-site transpeptidase (sortase) family protein
VPTRRGRAGAVAGLVIGILLLTVPGAVWLAQRPPPLPAAVAVAPAPVAVSASGVAATTPAAAPEEPAAPIRIRLPTLGTDAPVVPVGVDERGEMAVPDDVRTVGWYRFGPVPGTAGSSVLAGHVDDRIQGRGAFYRLVELAPGDPVLVGSADGTERRYLVADVERVDKTRLPTAQLFARDGPPLLTLITCGGEFDRAAGHFRDNVVVHARPA